MRITSNTYFDTTIRNIQDNYNELTRLQTQVQTQKLMQRPSDDPVSANQAIMLESNLKELQQYMENIQSGSEHLTFADQSLDTLMVPLTTAIEKAQQGLNAEQDSTTRAAISREIEAILDTFISVANTQLGDKNIFGGSEYLNEVYTRVGGDVLFNGNNDKFNVSVAQGERIQTNLTAHEVFGTSSTILDSEHNLNANLSDMSLAGGIPADSSKVLSETEMKIQGRDIALQAFVKAGITLNSAQYTLLKTNLDAFTSTSFTSLNVYKDAVRDATADALGKTAATLTTTESVQVTAVIDAAAKEYSTRTNQLAFQVGDGSDMGTIAFTMGSTDLSSIGSVVTAINSATVQAAGKTGAGVVDNSNIKLNARLETLTAFKNAGTKLSLTTQADLATQIDAITVDATTTSDVYTKAVQDAAIESVRVLNGVATLAYSGLTANEKIQVDAATNAARASFSTVEFKAAINRSGLVVRHNLSDQIRVSGANSSAQMVSALEMGGPSNLVTYVHETTLEANMPGNTKLGADRALSLADTHGNSLSVQLRNGDDVSTIAARINRAVNQPGNPEELRQIVASVDTSGAVQRLVIQGPDLFSISMDAQTEIVNASAGLYNGIDGNFQSIDDLRNGAGLTLGQQKLIADNSTNGFTANLNIQEGDSLEYLMSQINGLEGFEVALNADGSGLDLTNMGRYSTTVTPTTTTPPSSLAITAARVPGSPQTITFTGTTLSEMAREINAQSGISGFKFHAEVSSSGTSLIVSSNESFTLSSADTAMTKTSTEIDDFSSIGLIDSKLRTSLGFSATLDTNGQVKGQNILNRQVRLTEINGGEGFVKGSIRISIGITSADVDLSSASTLHDVKTLVEKALPGLVTVDLNNSGNGLAIASPSGDTIKIQELNGGATARSLALIKAPAVVVEGSDIQGGDLDPHLKGETLLKDLNGGRGIDGSGFTIKNGDKSTVITLDSNGDGRDDIRTLSELVNHINQKSKQDNVHVTAAINSKTGQISITSKLANTALEIVENSAKLPIYRAQDILPTATSTIDILSADGAKTINVNLSNGDYTINGTTTTRTLAAPTGASDLVERINKAASDASATVAFRAVIGADGNVDILSNENIRVSDTTTTYATATTSPNPPVLGEMAANLGFLGAFSESTPLSTLNNGSGANTGTFVIKYGPATSLKEVSVDIEFAENLGDVKRAIETATSNEVLVSFDRSHRLAFRLASGDDSQSISFAEVALGQDVATSLGLIHSPTIEGRALRDGVNDALTSSTKLSDLGLNLSSTNGNLVFTTTNGAVTLDLSTLTTVGEVVAKINSATVSDTGLTVNLQASIENQSHLVVKDANSGSLTVSTDVLNPASQKLGLAPDSELNTENHFLGSSLTPIHQAENFFSALTTLRDEFSKSTISESKISNTMSRLQELQNRLFETRGAAGGRISRFESIQTRYEQESLFVEDLFGKKTSVDMLQVTQRYLQQQQVYEAGLSAASRVLGTSLFSFI